MALKHKDENLPISEDEYLQGELIADIKHEYIDGHAYAMADVSKNHERITGNIFAEFRSLLRKTPCEPFASDLKVKTARGFFYPDAMVVCQDTRGNEYYAETPIIIVEVLSNSTRRLDETIKKLAYQAIPTLQEYVLIEQDFVDVEVCRRSAGWVSEHYFMGDTVTFESVGLTLPVEEIYYRVENEDVRAFVEEKRA